MSERLCVCVRPRPESPAGFLCTHVPVLRPDGAVLCTPQSVSDRGLASWHILWIAPGPEGLLQLESCINTERPPREVLITGPCGALQPNQLPGTPLFASEVLDPDNGPHKPCPSRALALPTMSRVLRLNIQTGKFLTTALPCSTAEHKAESGHGYGAIAVDQESALLCRPCQDADVAHAVIRFVYDPMEKDYADIQADPHLNFDCSLAVERNILRLLAGL